jgi:PBSX family phage terminase large subunit
MPKPFKSNKAYKGYQEFQGEIAVLYGGAGSGKSVAAAQKHLRRAFKSGGERFYVFRKIGATIRDSLWPLLTSLASEAELPCKFNKSDHTITFDNGSQIVCRGLDEPEKLKSLAGVTSVWLEEADQMTEQDWRQVEARVRGGAPTYKQFTLTFNPVDESSWLKKTFFDNHIEGSYVSHSTYKDNLWVTDDDIARYERWKLVDEDFYNVYCLGRWGNPNRGGEFYKKWSLRCEQDGLQYDNSKPLHLSFDFNVNPHMTCTVWQLEGKHARQIDEVCLEDPRNTTPATCIELINRYSNHKGGAFIYGDVNGKQQDTRKLEKDSNDYNIIMKELAIWRPTMRVPTSNPSVAMRGLWINAIFAANEGGISVLVDRKKCVKTIQDYYNVKEAPDGTKHKKKIPHPVTKVPFEPHGHTSDANDYFLCEAFKTDFDIFQRGGPKPKPIVGVRRTGSVRL